VANTQKIFAVIHHGKLVDRQSLRAEIKHSAKHAD
jgi:hypothetical protein